MKTTAAVKVAHSKIKEKLTKIMAMEQGIFKMVVEHLPAPCDAQKRRYKQFCPVLANP